MHLVVGGVVGLDRQERPRPDMKGNKDSLHATSVERFEHRRREMQPGSRRRDSALLSRIDRLVVAAVALVVRTLGGDVGRQRHVADSLQRLLQESAGEVEGERYLA